MLLTEWLNFRDICTLDSAICNRALRLIVLRCFSSEAFVLGTIFCNVESLNWIKNRSVGVRYANCNFTTMEEMSECPDEFLQRKGHTIQKVVTSVHIVFPVCWLEGFAHHCANLESISRIELSDSFVDAIRLLRQNCPKLHTFTSLRISHTVSANAMLALCEGGNSVLQCLTLPDTADINECVTIAAQNCPRSGAVPSA